MQRLNPAAMSSLAPALAVDRSPGEIAWIMSGLMLAMFLGFLDQTIVATALSSMARELDGWRLLSWVVSGYLVASTVSTPLYGRLSDLFGRRPLLLIAIAVFVGASALCALATSMAQLVAARVLQGLGAGGLWSVSHAVVADIIPPRQRGRYQGYFSSVLALANVLGPVLGGFCADLISWRVIFWINVPLGAAAFLLSLRHLARLGTPPRRAAVDWIGAALILAATTPILLGVTAAARSGGWLDTEVLGPVVLGLLLTAALFIWERRTPEPMLPLRLFRNPIFAVASLITFLSMAVMIALVILVPLNYQLVAGASAEDAGLRMLPITIGTVAGSFIAGQALSRIGRYRRFPIIGTVAAALLCALIAAFGLGRSLAFDIAVTALLGMAFGCQLAPVTVIVQNAVEPRDTGIGMSGLMFFRLVGGAFGVALLSTVLVLAFAAGALVVPGHEVLGNHPGLALFHLDETGSRLTPALLMALGETIGHAFARVFAAAATILAAAAVFALMLKEIPLRERHEAAR